MYVFKNLRFFHCIYPSSLLTTRENACSEMSSFYHGGQWGGSGTASVEQAVPPSPPSPAAGFELVARGGVFKLERPSEDDELFEIGSMILTSQSQVIRRTSECDEEPREQDHVRPLPLPFLSPLHLGPSSQAENKKKHDGQKNRPKSTLLGFPGSSSCMEYGNAKILSLLLPFPALTTRRSRKQRPSYKQKPSATRTAKSSPLAGLSPPQRKTYSGASCRGCTRVAPVLNIPNCCTPNDTAFLFGLGCLFLWGKEKKCRG
ncbi:hypothetical protein SAY87_003290 [Trapa incisa]|uniref:Uncharacterized protein n=1 Tax=Trapa incisa TaxID=236973 RepID=A0AAN7KNB2_9MYRT|nr:hypothetical protein SAY87_003290 [Trapa incisa]